MMSLPFFPCPTEDIIHSYPILRDFCGFSKVPDASLMTCFKQDFEPLTKENRSLKAHYKDNPEVDPYCMTDGLGIVRPITFLNNSPYSRIFHQVCITNGKNFQLDLTTSHVSILAPHHLLHNIVY